MSAETSQQQEERLRIEQVAERAGLSLGSVNRFEREGLLRSVGMDAAGDALYDEHAVERLALVKLMHPLGLSTSTMRKMVDDWSLLAGPAAAEGDRAAACVRLRECARSAEARRAALRAQLDGAQELTRALEEAIEHAEQREHVPTVAEAVEAIFFQLPELARPLPFDMLPDERDW